MTSDNLNPERFLASSELAETVFKSRNPDWRTESSNPVLKLPAVVPVQLMCGAKPLMCIDNVSKRIAAMGGNPVFGWNVEHDSYIDRHQSHVVWENDQKQLWDVTPVFGSIVGSTVTVEWRETIEFIRDDSAVFCEKSLPTRYVPTRSSFHIEKACLFLTIADDFLMARRNLEKGRYWTDRANREMKKGGFNCYWSVPDSLNNDDLLRASLSPDK